MTRRPGIRTRHSFSFGEHYDPANVAFGPMTCHDDHVLDPGQGFTDHAHRDVEIVTWVVSGGLVHDGTSVVRPGEVAVQTAGSGMRHSEVAGSTGCRFVQAWLSPDVRGAPPRRSVSDVRVVPGRLTGVAGRGGSLPLGTAGAVLEVARLSVGQRVTVPAAPRVHAFVATGSVVTAYGRLDEGDAVRCTDEPGVDLTAAADSEVLVWRFDRAA